MTQLLSKLLISLSLFCMASANVASNNEIEKASLGKCIAINYLTARCAYIKENKILYSKERVEKKIFGGSTHGWARVHDVYMAIKKEKGIDNEQIIIQTTVTGTPDDFKLEGILEGENQLLKFKIIREYLNRNSMILDPFTKLTSLPEQAYGWEKIGGEYRRIPIDNLQQLRLITIISSSEFDKLIQEFFVEN